MFARKLLSHFEEHADRLTQGLLEKIIRSGDCTELLRKVPRKEQNQTMHEIYRQMTDWLVKENQTVNKDYYAALGMRRAQQGVPFVELLSAVCAARQYFWEYISQETLLDEPSDFWGSVKLLHSLDTCLDRALRFVALGYEQSEREARAKSTGGTAA